MIVINQTEQLTRQLMDHACSSGLQAVLHWRLCGPGERIDNIMEEGLSSLQNDQGVTAYGLKRLAAMQRAEFNCRSLSES